MNRKNQNSDGSDENQQDEKGRHDREYDINASLITIVESPNKKAKLKRK
jgi:hypothetical protein